MKRLMVLLALTGCGTVVAETAPTVSQIDPPVPLVAEVLTIDVSTPVMVSGVPERLPAEQATATLPPPPTTTTTVPIPQPINGDCQTWKPLMRYLGIGEAAITFFVDGGIFRRETLCGVRMVNPDTGDFGICQISPIHDNAGYFGRVEYGEGGWLFALHGLRVGQGDPYAHEWLRACDTLYRVCGSGPWNPPYGCDNRRL